MDATKFGLFIANLRKEKNMTQAQLAERLNVTDKAISRWERGIGFPDISLLEPLSQALEISILELMKSEKIEETIIKSKEADSLLTDAFHTAQQQKQAQVQQEKRLIYLMILVAIILALLILLIDNIGWNIENILFTSIGVIFPLICLLIFIALLLLSIIRHLERKTCKHTLKLSLFFGCLLLIFFLVIFVLALFGFPAQR